MIKAELKKRWRSESGRAFLEQLVQWGRSGNGHEIRNAPFGVIADSGRLDLRGITFADRVELRRITINNADLTGAVLDKVRMESCAFASLFLDGASLQCLSERASTFSECKFYNTNFRDAQLGFRGSRYNGCYFERADFRQTGFVRPEFNDCCFDNCVYEEVDFRAASFRSCEFRGLINDAWFHGEYQLSPAIEQFPNARPNRMENVSFKGAQLMRVTFSDNCDLSSVIIPVDGKHALFSRWPDRIKSLFAISRNWPEPSRITAERFCDVCKGHAENQRWYLMCVDEFVQVYGIEVGTKIWETLHKS